MDAIVCVDKKWGIGKDGKLLVRYRNDFIRFRNITRGKIVVMGRKTMEEILNDPLKNGSAFPLKNRINIVLSRTLKEVPPNSILLKSFKELNDTVHCFGNPDVMIIGGSEIYRKLLPAIEKVYVTKLCKLDYNANTFFPKLDEKPSWSSVEEYTREELNKDQGGVETLKFLTYYNNLYSLSRKLEANYIEWLKRHTEEVILQAELD